MTKLSPRPTVERLLPFLDARVQHFASLQDDSQDRLDQIQTISVLLRLEQKIDSHTSGMNAQFAEKKQLDRIQQQIGESKAQVCFNTGHSA